MSRSGALRDHELKVATVLFADLVGSTALGERLGVELLGEVIAEYHATLSDVLNGSDATFDFVGDGVVAIFGVPTAVERHQARSLHTARSILDAVDELNTRLDDKYGFALDVRIGVNTGEILFDPDVDVAVGRMAGDVFNIAARLQQMAGVGEILVAERTIAAVPTERAVDLGPVRLEGRIGLVHAFRLDDEAPIGPVPLHGPLIGRQAELSALLEELDRVAESRSPRLVTVVGEAGIGKTHLLEAFGSACIERGIPVATASVAQTGGSSAMDPLAQLVLGAQLRRGATTPEEAVRCCVLEEGEDVEALIRAVGTEPRQAPGSPPGRAKRELSAAWRVFLTAVTRHHPQVFILEDMHWAAPELVELVCASSASGVAALFVCSGRPEFREAERDWPVAADRSRLLVLSPLDFDSTVRIARSVDPDLATVRGIPEMVYQFTEGNPFFTIELMRSFAESGGLPGLESHGAVRVSVPDTVQGVIANRIDRLPRAGRRYVHAASVLGREFTRANAERLAGMTEEEGADVIGDLVDRRILDEHPALEDGRLRFVHALTRDVAYGSIPRRDLHRLHETAARHFAERPPDRRTETSPLVAHHLLEAHGTLSADWEVDESYAERIRADAVRWSIRAAGEALGQTALTISLRFADAALNLATSDDETVDALECRGQAHYFAYEGDDAWADLTRAADLALQTGRRPPPQVAGLYIQALETAVRWTGGLHHPPSPASLRTRMDQAFELVGDDESRDRARLLMVVGFWPYATEGRRGSDLITPQAAIEAGEQAVELARRLGDHDLESAALDGLASVWISAGDYLTAEPVVHRRLRLIDRLSDPWERGDLCAMGAWIGYHRADYARGTSWALRGIEEFGPEYPSIGIHCLNWLGLNLYAAGRWDEAVGWLDRLEVDYADVRDPPPYVTPFMAAVALIQHLRGNDAQATRLIDLLTSFEERHPSAADGAPGARWAEFLAPIVSDRGDPERALSMIEGCRRRRASRLGPLLWARCWVVGRTGRWEEVDDLVTRCRDQAEQMGTPTTRPVATVLKGWERLTMGATDEAGSLFAAGLSGAAGVGDQLVAGWAELGLADVGHVLGRPTEAADHADDAARRFQRLGAHRLTREVEQLRAAQVL